MTWQHAVNASSHLRHLSICKVPPIKYPMYQQLKTYACAIGVLAIAFGCTNVTIWWLRKLVPASDAISGGFGRNWFNFA